MIESTAVRDGLLAFYDRFSAHDPEGFAAGIADVPGVSVIGSGPDEGHATRAAWLDAYEKFISQIGLRLESGGQAAGWERDGVGFATDTPRFVLPDGSFLPTRVTGVLEREDGTWKIVHLHFSVGVPDEDAIQSAP